MQTPMPGDTTLHLEFKEAVNTYESLWTWCLFGNRAYIGPYGAIAKDFTE